MVPFYMVACGCCGATWAAALCGAMGADGVLYTKLSATPPRPYPVGPKSTA